MKRLGRTASLMALSLASLLASAVALPVLKDASPGSVALAAVKGKAGSCGTNMYWKGGKCVDARAKSKSSPLDPRNL
jgi:hypothetical protein